MRKISTKNIIFAIILIVLLTFSLTACNDTVVMNKLLKFDTQSIIEISVSKDYVTKVTDNADKIKAINEKILGIQLKKYDKKTYDSDWDTAPSYKITYKQADSDGHFEIILIIRDVRDLDKGIITGTETLIGLRKIGNFNKKGSKEGFYTPIDATAEEIIFDLFLNVM